MRCPGDEGHKQRAGVKETGGNDQAGPAGPDERFTDALSWYLSRIGGKPLLTHEQEIELGRRVRAGCTRARRELIERNLALVVRIAGKYRGRGMSFEDLIQEGNLGLIKAVERYDPELGYRFSTYATPWIRKFVDVGLATKRRIIRLPDDMLQRIKRLIWEKEKFCIELSREPSPAELAARLDCPVHRVEQLLMVMPDAGSLSHPVGGDRHSGSAGEKNELSEMISERLSEEETPGAALAREYDECEVWHALAGIPPRHRHVLIRRFGLDGGDAATTAEIGAETGLCSQRVGEIQRMALKHLEELWSSPTPRELRRYATQQARESLILGARTAARRSREDRASRKRAKGARGVTGASAVAPVTAAPPASDKELRRAS